MKTRLLVRGRASAFTSFVANLSSVIFVYVMLVVVLVGMVVSTAPASMPTEGELRWMTWGWDLDPGGMSGRTAAPSPLVVVLAVAALLLGLLYQGRSQLPWRLRRSMADARGLGYRQPVRPERWIVAFPIGLGLLFVLAVLLSLSTLDDEGLTPGYAAYAVLILGGLLALAGALAVAPADAPSVTLMPDGHVVAQPSQLAMASPVPAPRVTAETAATGGGYCTACGEPVVSGAAFCARCGHPVASQGQTRRISR